MRLGPLGRAQESRLLPVPGAEQDRAAGSPAFLHKSPEGARLLEERGQAADGVARSIDPGVVVVATDNPFVGEYRSRDPRDDVAHRCDLPVEGDLEMDLRRAGTDVVGEGQSATPFPRSEGARKRGEQ